MVEFQTLRLVDGDQADAVALVALDGFATEVVIPLMEECVDVAGVFADEVGELVVEGTEIGTLTFDVT